MTSFQKTNIQADGQVFEKGDRANPRNAVSETVFSDGIVCLIDGKKKRNLRKWLVLQYGMPPVEYRRLYNLPDDYPMSVTEKLPTPSADIVKIAKPKVIARPRLA